jgi:hypothetical protein
VFRALLLTICRKTGGEIMRKVALAAVVLGIGVAAASAKAAVGDASGAPAARKLPCYVTQLHLTGPRDKRKASRPAPNADKVTLACRVGRGGAIEDCRVAKASNPEAGRLLGEGHWVSRIDIARTRATDGGSPVGCYFYITLTVEGPN